MYGLPEEEDNDVLEYLLESADKGDLAEFLENHKAGRHAYKGNYGFGIHFNNGKITKVTCDGRPLKLVSL